MGVLTRFVPVRIIFLVCLSLAQLGPVRSDICASCVNGSYPVTTSYYCVYAASDSSNVPVRLRNGIVECGSSNGNNCAWGCPTQGVAMTASYSNPFKCVSHVSGYCEAACSFLRSLGCVLCPVGKFSYQSGAAVTSNCTICTAGSYSSATGSSKCSICAPGTYAVQSGSTRCMNCSVGSYSNRSGSTSCTLCSPGSYQNGTARDRCDMCAVGQYQSGVGSALCTACPAGQSAFYPGSTACTVCTLAERTAMSLIRSDIDYRSGGLGAAMTAEYDTWWCLRQGCVAAWDYACYKYHAILDRFHFWGLNSALGLVHD